MKKHDEKLDKKRIRIARVVSFLMGFSQAILIYVMSSYFKNVVGIDEQVGVFYAVSYVVFLIILLNLHKVIRRVGKANTFYFALLSKIICIVALIFLDSSKISLILLMLYIVLGHIEWVTLDSIIESYSTDRMSGRIRGMHLTILSLGYVFGPLVSVYILANFGFGGIFVFSLMFNVIIFVLSLIGFRNVNHKFDQKLKIVALLKKIAKRRNVMRIYYVAFILEFFYATMVIYMPLHLLEAGFSWEAIGKIFTIMLIPFILLQYPAGLLADKKMGEKELLIFAVIVMGFSTGAIFFSSSSNFIFWGAILFVTRVGASLIEILRDSYFYKRIDSRDVDVINFFRTSVPTAYITATATCSLLIYFLQLKYVFILAAAVVFSALYPAIRLQDNKCEADLPKKC